MRLLDITSINNISYVDEMAIIAELQNAQIRLTDILLPQKI